MRLPGFDRVKRLYWSLRADLKDIHALVFDPLLSKTYYPEQPRKSKAATAIDLLSWWIRYREVNRYYYTFGLDRADANEQMVMPYRQFETIRGAANLHPPILAAYYQNSYNYVCVMRDKMLFAQVATSQGIPVPKTLATCLSTDLLWADTGRRMPLEELLLDTSLCIDCVCKPVDGIMGADVFLLKIEHGEILINHVKATLETLKSRLSARYLLQTRITQHQALAQLHPESVNTLRLITFNNDGKVELFLAALRIGTNGKTTDNWAGGGILVAVNHEKGLLHTDGYFKPAFGQRIQQHPDTGIVFDGFAVPYFEQAVALATRLHEGLPGLHSVGWDLAITPDGPVIIEGNDDWDGNLAMVLVPDFPTRFMSMFHQSPS